MKPVVRAEGLDDRREQGTEGGRSRAGGRVGVVRRFVQRECRAVGDHALGLGHRLQAQQRVAHRGVAGNRVGGA
jgi:hypothetical protein